MCAVSNDLAVLRAIKVCIPWQIASKRELKALWPLLQASKKSCKTESMMIVSLVLNDHLGEDADHELVLRECMSIWYFQAAADNAAMLNGGHCCRPFVCGRRGLFFCKKLLHALPQICPHWNVQTLLISSWPTVFKSARMLLLHRNQGRVIPTVSQGHASPGKSIKRVLSLSDKFLGCTVFFYRLHFSFD